MLDAIEDWISGGTAAAGIAILGTAVSVVVGACTFVLSLRDRRQAQARQITALIETPLVPRADGAARELRLTNGSGEPIFDIWVAPQPGHGVAQPVVLDALRANQEHVEPTGREIGGAEYRMNFPADLAFTDAANRRWERTGRAHELRRAWWWRKSAEDRYRTRGHADEQSAKDAGGQSAESELDR